MPELPEVETIKNDLIEKILNHRIEKIEVHDGRVLRGCTSAEFVRALEKRKIVNINRYGKALVFAFDQNSFLFIQLRMTGTWLVTKDRTDPASDRAIKITFILSPLKYLVYNDQRVLGSLTLTNDPQTLPFIHKLGTDPFDPSFSAEKLWTLIKQKKMPIKSTLLDQNTIAGIGNIYASEILFASGIDPKRPASSVEENEAKIVFKNMRAILSLAIQLRGTSMRNYRDASGQKGNFLSKLKVYGKQGISCTKCGTAIKRIVQSGRSTFYCEKCQK